MRSISSSSVCLQVPTSSRGWGEARPPLNSSLERFQLVLNMRAEESYRGCVLTGAELLTELARVSDALKQQVHGNERVTDVELSAMISSYLAFRTGFHHDMAARATLDQLKITVLALILVADEKLKNEGYLNQALEEFLAHCGIRNIPQSTQIASLVLTALRKHSDCEKYAPIIAAAPVDVRMHFLSRNLSWLCSSLQSEPDCVLAFFSEGENAAIAQAQQLHQCSISALAARHPQAVAANPYGIRLSRLFSLLGLYITADSAGPLRAEQVAALTEAEVASLASTPTCLRRLAVHEFQSLDQMAAISIWPHIKRHELEQIFLDCGSSVMLLAAASIFLRSAPYRGASHEAALEELEELAKEQVARSRNRAVAADVIDILVRPVCVEAALYSASQQSRQRLERQFALIVTAIRQPLPVSHAIRLAFMRAHSSVIAATVRVALQSWTLDSAQLGDLIDHVVAHIKSVPSPVLVHLLAACKHGLRLLTSFSPANWAATGLDFNTAELVPLVKLLGIPVPATVKRRATSSTCSIA